MKAGQISFWSLSVYFLLLHFPALSQRRVEEIYFSFSLKYQVVAEQLSNAFPQSLQSLSL